MAGTRYSAVRAAAAVLCSNAVCWNADECQGWFPYDFVTGTIYPVTERISRGAVLAGSVPRSGMGSKLGDGTERKERSALWIKKNSARNSAL